MPLIYHGDDENGKPIMSIRPIDLWIERGIKLGFIEERSSRNNYWKSLFKYEKIKIERWIKLGGFDTRKLNL